MNISILTVYYCNASNWLFNFRFRDFIEKWINPKKPTMICGDFNIDRTVENDLTRMLGGKSFNQIVQNPTTYRGNCIDHFYHNIAKHVKKVEHKLHYPCYSDHEAICVIIKDPWTRINSIKCYHSAYLHTFLPLQQ